ncbi:MAG: CRISPR-associated endonuclease Cas1, partial [Nitrospinales bacterium]
MSRRVIEIADSGRYLSVYRGFLKVSADGEELGRVPLDDIDVLMLSGHGNALSTNVINALLDRGAVIVVCGSN